MVLETAGLPAGPLALETIMRASLVVIADPLVAASGPAATLDELDGGGAALLERPAGTIFAFANPAESSLFVWAGRTFLAVVADPGEDRRLAGIGELTVTSGRLVVGAPDVVAAWGADVDTGDGSTVRARMHQGRTRLGLIVVAHTRCGRAEVSAGPGATAVSFPTADVRAEALRLPLAG
jgi:hypothetical protein